MSDLERFWTEQKEDPEFKEYCEEMQPVADFAKSILNARLQAGMTQRELSKLSGFPQAEISRLESCEISPSLKTMQRLARALNLRLKIELVPLENNRFQGDSEK